MLKFRNMSGRKRRLYSKICGLKSINQESDDEKVSDGGAGSCKGIARQSLRSTLTTSCPSIVGLP